MDSRLRERLDRWHTQIESLKDEELECLSLEAQEKGVYSGLFLKAAGKTVSDREALAYASEEWKNFQIHLVEAKTKYHHAKRELDFKQKAFEAEYLTYKIESDAIRKWPKEAM